MRQSLRMEVPPKEGSFECSNGNVCTRTQKQEKQSNIYTYNEGNSEDQLKKTCEAFGRLEGQRGGIRE